LKEDLEGQWKLKSGIGQLKKVKIEKRFLNDYWRWPKKTYNRSYLGDVDLPYKF